MDDIPTSSNAGDRDSGRPDANPHPAQAPEPIDQVTDVAKKVLAMITGRPKS